MCLEELFCPFTRDALNFQQPEIYAAPHRPAVFMFPLSLSCHHCAVCRSALSFCSVTAHAHRKSRVRSNNAPTRKVYVTLVYLLLFAVELLCCDMQYRADLGNTMVCSHSLIIHVYLMFLYTESSFFIHFPLIDAIWWALSHIIRDHISVWIYDRETSVFLYHIHTHTHTHTHWSARDVSMRTKTHKQHLQNCSESHFMSISPFHLSKAILISCFL